MNNMEEIMNSSIDIVLPWVDGNDPMWQREKNAEYLKIRPDISANSEVRYQSFDNLKYWFRLIDKNMPWVNKIFLITWGHIPEWVDLNCKKLRIVRHDEYIPKEFLPTFNSNTIEMNVHRIKDLSENFILFNDDLFVLQPIAESYFFQNDHICDQAIESPIMPVDIGDLSGWSCRVKANNVLMINKYFNKREVQSKHREKWFSEIYGERLARNKALSYWNNFCGFHDPHMANSFKKMTYERLWKLEEEVLTRASMNKFRAENDYSQYLARYWQLCEGDFVPRLSEGKAYSLTCDNCSEISQAIVNQKHNMISLTEMEVGERFDIVKKVINEALAQLVPDKCIFEI